MERWQPGGEPAELKDLKAARKGTGRAEILLDALLLFLLTALLIAPLFRAGYLDQWQSIESTFIADARFLIAHWPHPQWQPLWYGGTRFDYIYPPMLRYGTALIAMASGYEPVRAYHMYIAFFYCVGIASVYLLVRAAGQPRGMAWLAAVMTALMSPSFLLLKSYRHDSFRLAPHRLGVLVRWGEGPHISALALLPLALAFSWRALERRRRTDIALAGAFSAAVVSTNFYGATALAVFYPILVWSFWITRCDRRIAVTAIAIPAVAYGLTAFWLVPSYFKITAENMKYVSSPGSTASLIIAVIVAGVFAFATRQLGSRRRDRTWAIFIAGCAILLSLNVVGNYFFNFRITGEPHRWIPELDLVLILMGATVLLWMWRHPSRRSFRIAAAAVVLVALLTTKSYVRHAWQIFREAPDYRSRVEYQVPEWLWKNRPGARTYTTGSVRFWFDVWHDLPEMGGGSDQGLINGLTQNAGWEINLAPEPEASILWAQSLGVDVVYISGPQSEEMYKDTLYPQKFEGRLPVIYDDHRGNTIYEVPRRFPARVRVVETARLNVLQTPQGNEDAAALRAYTEVIEQGPDAAAELTRDGPDAMRIRARLAAGQSIVAQETYDPAWHAWSGTQSLPVHKDPMGFLAVDPPPGDREIRLQFVTPMENRVGRLVTLVTLLLLVTFWVAELRARGRP
jgi:hypothetical protein